MYMRASLGSQDICWEVVRKSVDLRHATEGDGSSH
jgi:hypothetical protein